MYWMTSVANEGIVDPKEFYALLKKYDVRVFGFLMGNNANWPLMRLIAETSGGFYDVPEEDRHAVPWAIASALAHKRYVRDLVRGGEGS